MEFAIFLEMESNLESNFRDEMAYPDELEGN